MAFYQLGDVLVAYQEDNSLTVITNEFLTSATLPWITICPAQKYTITAKRALVSGSVNYQEPFDDTLVLTESFSVQECRYRGVECDPDSLEWVVTDNGYCLQFTPQRVLVSGPTRGLSITLVRDSTELESGDVSGWVVYLTEFGRNSTNGGLARTTSRRVFARNGEVTFISVTQRNFVTRNTRSIPDRCVEDVQPHTQCIADCFLDQVVDYCQCRLPGTYTHLNQSLRMCDEVSVDFCEGLNPTEIMKPDRESNPTRPGRKRRSSQKGNDDSARFHLLVDPPISGVDNRTNGTVVGGDGTGPNPPSPSPAEGGTGDGTGTTPNSPSPAGDGTGIEPPVDGPGGLITTNQTMRDFVMDLTGYTCDVACIMDVGTALASSPVICNCSHACTTTVYDVVNSGVALHGDTIDVQSTGQIDIHFSKLQVETTTEEQEQTISLLLVSMGGLFGFWTGYSVISLVEVFDLVFLRLFPRLFGQKAHGGLGSK